MGKALVIFSTRTGETKGIAELIAEGIRMEGSTAKTAAISEIKNEADFGGYDAYVFGSATYHGEMMQSMKTMLFLAEKAELQGKVGGSFGAFGWSGEAPDRIYETMKNIFRMEMVSGPLRLKSRRLDGGIQMAQTYGKEIGKRIKDR
ncbi:MAG: nitric oxide synthase [Deltaproteobacteria bacterium HGW-Deltaproteobacteria-15]|jgi:flavorubredoxin|nr:MAG: nitric oxide synthase [Deltaproteobacteria bacterium HGW-Deltaproteobacteria-15]